MTTTSPRLVGMLLAGGIGSRFRSATPKVVHDLLGRPLVGWAAAAVRAAGAESLVVVAGPTTATAIGQAVPDASVAIQEQAHGTGDAAAVGAALVDDAATVLIAAGDTPALHSEALAALAERHADQGGGVTVLSATVPDPSGYGRILRDASGQVTTIVEHRDADEAVRRIREVNVGVYVVGAALLKRLLQGLRPDNAQGELYLVDIVAAARAAGEPVQALDLASPSDMQGVNDRAQLAAAAAILRDRLVAHWQAQGVTFLDPASVWLEPTVDFEADVVIGPNVQLGGATRVARGARLDQGCVLYDTHVGAEAHLKPYVVCDGAELGVGVAVGPFAHLRPGTVLGAGAKVGNFVETKKTTLGEGSKANHLSYLGDATIGKNVNVGAGTITCNYDGNEKHPTVLEDDVFIGSDSQLVAPVTVGRGAYVGAGTTVTKDVPPGALAVSRTPQRDVPDYAARKAARRGAHRPDAEPDQR